MQLAVDNKGTTILANENEKDRIKLLQKLSQIKCQIVITVDCWDDLIGKNTRTVDVGELEAIKKNIGNWG